MALRLISCVCASLLVLLPTLPPWAPAWAEQTAQADTATFNVEQLDALLAPIALYPDTLLTQIVMASAYPLQIVQSMRWLRLSENKALSGDALAKALQAQSWDPSVKALVPFPQVLTMMNDKLEWTEQVGYAAATQQVDVLDSVQRLRRQAAAAGNLTSTAQQIVRTEAPGSDATAPVTGAVQTIIIEPAKPDVVYVPTYNPATTYGAWPYPSYPPVVLPPPPDYAVSTALAAGLAFGAGVAIVGSLWNVGSSNWRGGNVNVNISRYNAVNANRAQVKSAAWRPPNPAAGAGRTARLVAGPVGGPARLNGLPANAIGRPSVKVPADAVDRPARPGGGGGIGGPGGRLPGNGQGPGAAKRPTATPLPAHPAAGAGGGPAADRLGAPPGAARPSAPRQPVNRPDNGTAASRQPAAARPSGAFGGIADGRKAGQFSARGSQSRQLRQPPAGGRAGGGRGGR